MDRDVQQRAGVETIASTAPLTAPGEGQEHDDEEEMPSVTMTRRRVIASGVFVLAVIAFLYFVLPEISGMKDTWQRVADGDHAWLAAALGFEVLSMASYIALFHGIHVPPGSRITLRDSYLMTMAGLAATRLFAAGGAGGVAVTAWALRRSGMERRDVAERMIAFLILLYGVYVLAMIVCGVGLRTGLFSGEAPFALTIVPAIIGVIAIVLVLPLALVPEDFPERIERMAPRRPRTAKWLRRLALGPASMRGGIRFALYKAAHPDRAMVGVATWWIFNVAVLWACFHAFGESPPLAVIIQGYFVGMLGNLLPLPGGIGGVDGGMIGAFVAFGVGTSLAIPAVLAYRIFAFWLPTIPGIVAYLGLRKRVAGWRRDPAPA
jgi:putative heme transporter